MPTEFLTDAQELAYGRYSGPPSNQQLEGYFHLDDADLELVKVRRGAQNKLGFALQLTTARFLGTFLTEPTDVPPNVVAYVAAQLGIRDVAGLAEYGARSNTAWEHAAEIRRIYGYRDFSDPGVPQHLTTGWLVPAPSPARWRATSVSPSPVWSACTPSSSRCGDLRQEIG